MAITGELLQRCAQQDRRAQNELYRLLYSPLLSIALRYANDEQDAKSNLNQGFVKIVFNLERYNPDVAFLAWAKRIMINFMIDEYRKSKKGGVEVYSKDFSEAAFDNKVTELNLAEYSFDKADLMGLLKKLPPMTEKVFNLFAIDGYSHLEIANMLGISDGTSKWHVMNARQILREMLGKNHKTSKSSI